jgi:hypothetical protein
MKLKTKLIYQLFFINILFLCSCQKENNLYPKASICPEIAKNNYEEAGVIINDFLSSQVNNRNNKTEELKNYLQNCNCIDSVSVSSNHIYSYPLIKEFSIRFIFKQDTIQKVMDIYMFDNSKLEFHKFHN